MSNLTPTWTPTMRKLAQRLANNAFMESIERAARERELLLAAYHGDLPALRVAKERGSREFKEAAQVATRQGFAAATKMLNRWYEEESIVEPMGVFVFRLAHKQRYSWSGLSSDDVLNCCSLVEEMSEQQRKEVMIGWKSGLAARDAHERILDIAIALRPLQRSGQLCIYSILWILEWSQGPTTLLGLTRVRLLEAVDK
jgi:hypothetical protein